jgi:hypothetical protein
MSKKTIEEDAFDSLWDDDSTKPESAWFAFVEIGDAIEGELVMEPFDKEGNFGTQKVYIIKRKSDGAEFNVGLKHTTHALNIRQLKGAEVGDTLAFRLKDLVDVGKGNLCKSMEVRIRPKK